MIKLCHIAPVNYVELGIAYSDMDMILAHIADENDVYAEAFKKSDNLKLLDNGAFELDQPYGVDKMIEIGKKVEADILVLPDYPLQPWEDGWDEIDERIKAYKDAGFKVMFAPQSLKGDESGYMLSLVKAVMDERIDFIGLSILACPNAFDKLPEHKVREKILGMMANMPGAEKRFHILGMLGSVDEIKRLTYYSKLIHSWDTSAAVWYGINDLTVEGRTEKFTKHVDFDIEFQDDKVEQIIANINYMRSLR